MRTLVSPSAKSAFRRVLGTAVAFALAAVALVAAPAGASEANENAQNDGRTHKNGVCPEGYVCLHPGGVGAPEPYLIPECGSEYFVPPYLASAVENHTDVIVWFTTADGSATWIPPHSSVTLWPVEPVDSVVSECFVPMPF